MVAALDLVPGVVLGRVVALVDAAADGQGFADHPLPGHVPRDLVLDAGPDLVAVPGRPGPQVPALGPRTGEQPRLAGERKPPFGLVGLVLRPHVGRPVVLPDRPEGGSRRLFRVQVPETDLVRPPLAEHMVGQAAVAVLPLGVLLQIDSLDEVLAVEHRVYRVVPPRLEDPAALRCERAISHFPGHLLGGAERSQVQRPHHGVGTVVVLVVRLVLATLDEAVSVGVLIDEELRRTADIRPVAPEEAVVGRRLVLPVGLEDVSPLRVAGPQGPPLSPEPNRPRIGIEPDARCEVLHLPYGSLQFREEAGHGVLVVPHVPARSAAASHALPGPEATVLPPLAGRAGQVRHRRVQPIEQPVGQAGVVVGSMPKASLVGQPLEVPCHVSRHGARIPEARSVAVPDEGLPPVHVCHVPGEYEHDVPFLTGVEGEGPPHRAAQCLPHGLLRLVSGITEDRLGHRAVRKGRAAESFTHHRQAQAAVV